MITTKNILRVSVILMIISTIAIMGCSGSDSPSPDAPERFEQREEIEEEAEENEVEEETEPVMCTEEDTCASGGQCFIERSEIGEDALITPEMCAISPIVQESQCECPEGLTCAANLAEGESIPTSWTCQRSSSGLNETVEDEE